MPLGSRIKVKVLTKEGKHTRTIQRCFRPFLGKYTVFYECNRYYVEGNGLDDAWSIRLR